MFDPDFMTTGLEIEAADNPKLQLRNLIQNWPEYALLQQLSASVFTLAQEVDYDGACIAFTGALPGLAAPLHSNYERDAAVTEARGAATALTAHIISYQVTTRACSMRRNLQGFHTSP
jgi:hypothetical protein